MSQALDAAGAGLLFGMVLVLLALVAVAGLEAAHGNRRPRQLLIDAFVVLVGLACALLPFLAGTWGSYDAGYRAGYATRTDERVHDLGPVVRQGLCAGKVITRAFRCVKTADGEMYAIVDKP